MFDVECRKDVVRFRRPRMRCLSTGWNGGFCRADAIDAFSVPTEWPRQDITAYAKARRRDVGFEDATPSLFTAVEFTHLRGARAGPTEVFATVGLSNPAALPMEPAADGGEQPDDEPPVVGTVNLVVGTTRALEDAALSNLLAVAAEAKAATLVAETGFSGTTSDAIIVACDPDGSSRRFTGSSTEVGSTTRACVRDAITASLASRYPDGGFPQTVEAADHGVRTDRQAAVFRIAQ